MITRLIGSWDVQRRGFRRLSSDAGDSGAKLFSRSPPLVVTSIPYHRGYEFWGRFVWEEAVNLKLSFQDPFSCSALHFGDALMRIPASLLFRA